MPRNTHFTTEAIQARVADKHREAPLHWPARVALAAVGVFGIFFALYLIHLSEVA